MDDLEEIKREYLLKIRVLERTQRMQWVWIAATALLAAVFGFALAMALVDPLTVIAPCEGVEV